MIRVKNFNEDGLYLLHLKRHRRMYVGQSQYLKTSDGSAFHTLLQTKGIDAFKIYLIKDPEIIKKYNVNLIKPEESKDENLKNIWSR